MVPGALGKISRLCLLSDGPSNDSFQLNLLSPLWCPPPLMPQSPTRLLLDPPLLWNVLPTHDSQLDLTLDCFYHQTDNAFNCSRHGRLVTVVFLGAVYKFPYLLTYL